MQAAPGTAETREYYATRGWAEVDGDIVEGVLFGPKEDGPIRQAAFRASVHRIRNALSSAGPPLELLECGCGGYPETTILDLCGHYTGIDFSDPGLAVAAATLRNFDIASELHNADVCDLPFEDESFDAVYSAHTLYLIADRNSQEAAFGEIVRVLRDGGVAVLIVANAYPVLFPVQLVKRLIAATPVLARAVAAAGRTGPVPYKPLSMRTMRRILEPHGAVDIVCAGIPTVAFNQRVTEHRGLGKLAWHAILWLETGHPKLAARLGHHVQITFVKGAASA